MRSQPLLVSAAFPLDFSTTMSQILQLPGVSDTAKRLLVRLLSEPLLPLDTLQKGVEAYRNLIHEAERSRQAVNRQLGDEIAWALQNLLARVDKRTGPKNLLLIQAAVRYFIIQDDGEGHDLQSRDGLDDDGVIVNAILRYFGRDDLMVRSFSQKRHHKKPFVGGAALQKNT